MNKTTDGNDIFLKDSTYFSNNKNKIKDEIIEILLKKALYRKKDDLEFCLNTNSRSVLNSLMNNKTREIDYGFLFKLFIDITIKRSDGIKEKKYLDIWQYYLMKNRIKINPRFKNYYWISIAENDKVFLEKAKNAIISKYEPQRKHEIESFNRWSENITNNDPLVITEMLTFIGFKDIYDSKTHFLYNRRKKFEFKKDGEAYYVLNFKSTISDKFYEFALSKEVENSVVRNRIGYFSNAEPVKLALKLNKHFVDKQNGGFNFVITDVFKFVQYDEQSFPNDGNKIIFDKAKMCIKQKNGAKVYSKNGSTLFEVIFKQNFKIDFFASNVIVKGVLKKYNVNLVSGESCVLKNIINCELIQTKVKYLYNLKLKKMILEKPQT